MGGCAANERIFETTISFNDGKNVSASGRNKLFFLAKPVLSERWRMDNRLSWLLFSQSKIYEITIKDTAGGESKKIKLYDFDIANNEYGIRQIVSIENDTSPFIGKTLTAAGPINEKNATFFYLYEINYTDNTELGKKNLTTEAKDVFLSEKKEDWAIYSRQLSLGGQTETGAAPAWETTRKSSIAAPLENRTITLFFGALGVLMLLMMLKFRLK